MYPSEQDRCPWNHLSSGSNYLDFAKGVAMVDSYRSSVSCDRPTKAVAVVCDDSPLGDLGTCLFNLFNRHHMFPSPHFLHFGFNPISATDSWGYFGGCVGI